MSVQFNPNSVSKKLPLYQDQEPSSKNDRTTEPKKRTIFLPPKKEQDPPPNNSNNPLSSTLFESKDSSSDNLLTNGDPPQQLPEGNRETNPTTTIHEGEILSSPRQNLLETTNRRPSGYVLHVEERKWEEAQIKKIFINTHPERPWDHPNRLYKYLKHFSNAQYRIEESYLLSSKAEYFKNLKKRGVTICPFLSQLDKKEKPIIKKEKEETFESKLRKTLKEGKFWKDSLQENLSLVSENRKSILSNSISIITGYGAMKHSKTLAFLCFIPSLCTLGDGTIKITKKIIDNKLFSPRESFFEARCIRLTEKIVAINKEIKKINQCTYSFKEIQQMEKTYEQLTEAKNYFLRTCQEIQTDTGKDSVLLPNLKRVDWNEDFLKINGHELSYEKNDGCN